MPMRVPPSLGFPSHVSQSVGVASAAIQTLETSVGVAKTRLDGLSSVVDQVVGVLAEPTVFDNELSSNLSLTEMVSVTRERVVCLRVCVYVCVCVIVCVCVCVFVSSCLCMCMCICFCVIVCVIMYIIKKRIEKLRTTLHQL